MILTLLLILLTTLIARKIHKHNGIGSSYKDRSLHTFLISTFAFGFFVFALYDITQFFYKNPENCTGLYNDYRNFLLILPLLDYLPLQCALALQTINMRKSMRLKTSSERLTIPSVFVSDETENNSN